MTRCNLTTKTQRHKAFIFLCLCVFVVFISACAPSTPVPNTPTPLPTKFALAALTDTPIATRTLTFTPTLPPTTTPTLTRTRTRTLTPTVKPNTSTPSKTPTISKPTITPVILGDEEYGVTGIISSSAPHPAAEMNLSARGFVTTTAQLSLIDLDGPTDSVAPRLHTLFSDRRVPNFSAVYQLYRWDEICGCRGTVMTTPEVTMTSMAVNASEMLRLPESGYNLGEEYNAIVLYADSERITFAYTRDDNPVRGYVIYLEGVAVEANLLALYQQANRLGRGELPGLRNGQAFARTLNTELKLAIRDAGGFMDPRSKKDWWRK
ncbi:MAG: hypothetical protein HZB51_16285 [Chloroflexi bacterium]|nr:hypothetical protein [Chloroflexota bacterium]